MFLGQSSCDTLLSVDVRHPLNFHILKFSSDTTFLKLFKDKNLPFGAPQTLEFRNFPYVFQWGETGCSKLLKSID
jgi:hypothetical protein